ncbi:MAG: hypothetical protein RL442_1585 [Pseudomonadota bacterium]|jgi:hypothetical protein
MSNIFQPTVCIHCGGPLIEIREMGNFCSQACFKAFDLTNGTLHELASGMYIRPATRDEALASALAAQADGGSGVILVDNTPCYVEA